MNGMASTGSKRASGAETPEAPHTYRNLQQLGAVAADVPDAASAAGVELRRQLEEEAARRAQVEKQMRDLQMRELEAKRYAALGDILFCFCHPTVPTYCTLVSCELCP